MIGGTSLFGGRGQIRSAVLGAIVIAMIDNGLGLLNVSAGTKFIVTGLVLLAAVTLDSLSRRGRVADGPRMRTSLGIWALGPMVTRFVPGGYQPEHAYERRADRRQGRRARSPDLEELIDGYEFHYPQELSEDNLDEVHLALDGHDDHLHRDRPAPRSAVREGGLSSPDPGIRSEAIQYQSARGRLRRSRSTRR